MAIKKLLSSSPTQAHHAGWVGFLMQELLRPGASPSPAPPLWVPHPEPGHLLPVCPVVTVVGLGLLSAPTPATPDEEERKLQSVEGARPARDNRQELNSHTPSQKEA